MSVTLPSLSSGVNTTGWGHRGSVSQAPSWVVIPVPSFFSVFDALYGIGLLKAISSVLVWIMKSILTWLVCNWKCVGNGNIISLFVYVSWSYFTDWINLFLRTKIHGFYSFVFPIMVLNITTSWVNSWPCWPSRGNTLRLHKKYHLIDPSGNTESFPFWST